MATPPTLTPAAIEAEAASALAWARAGLRESLETLARDIARELARLEAGHTIEPRLADDASRVEVRAAKVKERETALALVRQIRAITP